MRCPVASIISSLHPRVHGREFMPWGVVATEWGCHDRSCFPRDDVISPLSLVAGRFLGGLCHRSMRVFAVYHPSLRMIHIIAEICDSWVLFGWCVAFLITMTVLLD